MLKLGTVFALLLGLLSPALAQTTFTMPPPAGVTVIGIQVVASCGGGSLTANQIAYVAMDTTGALCTNASGGGGGLSVTDGASFTANSSKFTPIGGQYNSSPTTLTSGDQGTWAFTAQRAGIVDVTAASSNALYSAITSPVPCSVTAAWNTNTGLTNTQPVACNGSANPYVDLGKNNGTAGTPSTSVLSVQGASSMTPILVTPSAPADPCFAGTKTNLPISQNGTSSVQLIALSGSTVIYVCSLSLVAAGATTVAITTGTASACASNTTAVIGSTTVANSMSLSANGGLTLGSGVGTIAKGVAAYELCMVLGTNVYVAGNLTYVQQ